MSVHTRHQAVAALPWNRWPLRVMGVRIFLACNQWPDCRGIGGHFGVELVATLPWNTHSRPKKNRTDKHGAGEVVLPENRLPANGSWLRGPTVGQNRLH